jgi:phosphatidylethanolamine/phosphatidyl-N-methylethanolamine N-methyltransferase
MAMLLSMAIPESGEPVVVELGAGTGACTGVIQHRLGGRGHHIAVAINPTFAELLATRYRHVEVICGRRTTCLRFCAI